MKPIDAAQRVVPLVILGYTIFGLIFRRGYVIWGLPSTFWYTMGGIVAMLVLLISCLERE